MEKHECVRVWCNATAMYVVVSGCLKNMHVNTRWYCTKHYMEMTDNKPEPERLTCWACFKEGSADAADDFVVQRL